MKNNQTGLLERKKCSHKNEKLLNASKNKPVQLKREEWTRRQITAQRDKHIKTMIKIVINIWARRSQKHIIKVKGDSRVNLEAVTVKEITSENFPDQ